MRKKNLRYIILSCLIMLIGLSQVSAQQTELTVVYNSGIEEIFIVNEDGKLYFDVDKLFILDNSATVRDIYLSDIRKILVANYAGISDLNTSDSDFYIIYPNPVQDYVNIKSININEKLQVTVYSINGKVLLEGKYFSDNKIDLSFLKTGMYFIKVNDQTLKLSKL
ncbi:MAG: T9SS type A sorting domain-containing protein [Bacteroidales bacterium]|nr:T9SS type A sorting domain-containing protein [Bacteroidales bacterium]